MNRQSNLFKSRPRISCLILCFLLATPVFSRVFTVGHVRIDPQDFSPDKDPKTRIASCLSCHGRHAGGDIDFGPDVHFGTPALRGMRYDYLKQSLMDYKAGIRRHKEMSVISSILDEETIDFMARTFATYPAPRLKSADELASLAGKDSRFRSGQAIAKQGVPEKRIPACMNCHGTLGEGKADSGPRLAGQNSIYMQQQLTAYASKTRRTTQALIMQPVVTGLSVDEVEAVAHYYQNLIHPDQP